jgi:hypothetical protein
MILAGSGVAWSQSVQGVITGTITDPTGAVVPGATVTITNAGTNISQTTTTGSDGSYRFALVPPGTYTLEIKAANFAGVRASGIVVEASQVVPFNRQLELAKTSQLVEVTAEVPLVQTATSDLGFTVDAKTIENAALVDRDIFDVLPFMAPSVSPGLDMSPTSGGAREAGTSYILNGTEDNNNFSAGAININPPLESVEDFTLLTNVMGAQYGRGAGALVTANQKSGANQFHGALYEQNRNATLNANDFFYNRDYNAALAAQKTDPNVALLPKRPKYIKNQFGGAVGGPIRKDKTFFFFAYDRFKLLQGVTAANTFVPTSTALNFAKANAGPIGQQILAAYPPRTSDSRCPLSVDAGPVFVTGGTNTVGCLSFSDPQTTTTDSYYGRLDQNFSTSDRLSFVANISRLNFVDTFGGGGLQANGGGIPNTVIQNQHNLALIETHTYNARLANELNFSHNRFFNPSIEGNPAMQTVPQAFIDNGAAGCLNYIIGPGEGGQVVAFTQDRWSLQDNVTYTVGRHALKFGGSGNYGILYRNWDLGLPGQYEFGELTSFSTGPLGNSPCPIGAVITPSCDGTLQPDGTIANISSTSNANFTGDYPYFEETSIDPRIAAPNKANAYRHYTTHDYSAFLQDDWKATSRLTINLGLRWERFGAPSEDHGIIAQFTNISGCDITTDRTCIRNARVNPVGRMWKTYNKDFGPRLGFAWDPFGKGKMAVRGGYGIFYDRIFDNIWSNGAWNPPFYALLDLSAACGDVIFYNNPASIGKAYDPATLPPGTPVPGRRVSVRTMDVNMHDSSGQNFYFGVEREFFGGLLLSAKYQGSLGRHLPMLENYNRTDGQAYNVTYDTSTVPPTYVTSLSNRRPNRLYTGFNYRSNSVSSNYNSLIVEAQKRLGHGLQFQTGYTYSKLLDVNSELFAGCSTIGGFSAPYYYISNAQPKLNYGRSAEDHRHAYKFNVTYELPFLKSEKGFVGHALGGWSLGSFLQFYSGHPVDVYLGNNGIFCRRFAAKDAAGNPVLDQNGIPFDIGGNYKMDGVCNDHPMFLGSSLDSAYRGGSPADGIFIDNNQIGCGFPGMPATIANVNDCNAQLGVKGSCPNSGVDANGNPCTPSPGTPNTIFGNPAYPAGATPFERFGTLGRNVFHGPRLVTLDLGVHKTFKFTETVNLRFSADAQNLANHANFDGIQANLNNRQFGKAQLLVGTRSRVMSVSLRLAF